MALEVVEIMFWIVCGAVLGGDNCRGNDCILLFIWLYLWIIHGSIMLLVYFDCADVILFWYCKWVFCVTVLCILHG